MPRLKWFTAVAPCALLVLGAACSSNNAIGTTPTQNSTTVEFTGTLKPGNSFTHPFTGLAAGQVSASITSLSPNCLTYADDGTTCTNYVTVGLELGLWDGSTTCQRVVHNDKAIQSSQLVATETAAGSLCVSVNDATGTLPGSVDYDILVTHP